MSGWRNVFEGRLFLGGREKTRRLVDLLRVDEIVVWLLCVGLWVVWLLCGGLVCCVTKFDWRTEPTKQADNNLSPPSRSRQACSQPRRRHLERVCVAVACVYRNASDVG